MAEIGVREWEITVLVGIFILQVSFLIYIWRNIYSLGAIFNEKPTLESSNQQFEYLSRNKIQISIIESINSYIQKNRRNIIDFHIINDIVERNINSFDEDISNQLPTPLYLGLAGTMVGIIFGLFAIDLAPGTGNPGEVALPDLTPLIEGVSWAMIVSVIGLGFTTFLSIFIYRPYKAKLNIGKNDFLSQIQTELLPTLIKSDDAAMQELSKELRYFSDETPRLVSSLDTSMSVVKENIDKEIDLINEVRKLDVKKISKSNVDIFNNLSGMMDTFAAFPKYYQELNLSLGKTSDLSNNLHTLVSSTNDVNIALTEIKSIIESGNAATHFFNEHIRSFELYSEAVNVAIGSTNKSFDKALQQLDIAVKGQIDAFSAAIGKYDSSLSQAFNASIQRFNEAAEGAIHQYNIGLEKAVGKYNDSFETAIEKYQSSFNEAITSYGETLEKISPQFDQLKNLEKLESLEQTNQILKRIEEAIVSQSTFLEKLNPVTAIPATNTKQPFEKKGVAFYTHQAIYYIATITMTVVSIYLAYKLYGNF